MELVTHEDVDGRADRRITHRIDRSAWCSLGRIEEDSLALVEMWQETPRGAEGGGGVRRGRLYPACGSGRPTVPERPRPGGECGVPAEMVVRRRAYHLEVQ